ncbi:MAG: electron transport complex subunit E [Lentimicrobiaceae bacterium]|nr:electron transport complex subunit E [Lentimicrobiaceae bacterium]
MNNKLNLITRGIIKENPTLIMVLGLCPSLAVTTSVINGLGMGLATTFVMLCSNTMISALRKVIPNQVRIPIFIVLIATFTSMVDLLIQGYVPALAESLGLFIPLIAVNCVVFARVESFAAKNNIFDSFLDGLGMGLGFTFALFLIGSVREILGSGSIFNYQFIENSEILIFVLAPGAFFVMGFIIAAIRFLQTKSN